MWEIATLSVVDKFEGDETVSHFIMLLFQNTAPNTNFNLRDKKKLVLTSLHITHNILAQSVFSFGNTADAPEEGSTANCRSVVYTSHTDNFHVTFLIQLSLLSHTCRESLHSISDLSTERNTL